MLFGRKTRKPISIPVKDVKEWKYTTCNYCSTGCAIEIGLNEKGKIVTSRGHAGADVNRGKALCACESFAARYKSSPQSPDEAVVQKSLQIKICRRGVGCTARGFRGQARDPSRL